MKQTGTTTADNRPKVSLDQFLSKSFDNGESANGFVDQALILSIFKKKDIYEIVDDDPDLDKLTYVIRSQKIDSKTMLRNLEPYSVYVCDKCGFNIIKDLNIDDTQDIDKIMKEKPEALAAFERIIKMHKVKVHPGISPSQAITKRNYYEAQRFGKEI